MDEKKNTSRLNPNGRATAKAATRGPVSGRTVKKRTQPASATDRAEMPRKANSLVPTVCATNHSRTKKKGGLSSPPCRMVLHIYEKLGLRKRTAVTNSSLLK